MPLAKPGRMTLEAFSEMYARLFRLAAAGASEGIRGHGLLTAATAARLAGVELPQAPRPDQWPLQLPDGTLVMVTDNKPLQFSKLAPALDDGLTPLEWLDMLNRRVFFWPSRRLGLRNLTARKGSGYQSEWQTYDTRLLLAEVWSDTEITPINTGATLHTPARRGRSTFTLLDGLDFQRWRRSRGLVSLDIIKEVTTRCDIPRAADALISVEPA